MKRLMSTFIVVVLSIGMAQPALATEIPEEYVIEQEQVMMEEQSTDPLISEAETGSEEAALSYGEVPDEEIVLMAGDENVSSEEDGFDPEKIIYSLEEVNICVENKARGAVLDDQALSREIINDEEDPDEVEDDLVAFSNACGPYAYWNYADGILTITGSGAIEDIEFFDALGLTLDDEIEIVFDGNFTEIGDEVFRSVPVASVTIPEGITSIGVGAFSLNQKLQSVDFPSTLADIGDGAFSECGNLKQITLRPGVKTIGDEAFYCCSLSGDLKLPETVEEIGAYAFRESFDEVILPASVKSVGEEAIYCNKCIILSRNVELNPLSILPHDYASFEVHGYRGSTAEEDARLHNWKFIYLDPKDISKVTVSGLSSKMYTGKALKPIPVVKDGGVTLKEGTDYTLSYKNNTNVGTASVIITGKGNYTGVVTKTFSILPISVTGIKLDKTTQTLTAGKTMTLKAMVSPANATNKNVSWKSSNTAVATVNTKGVVTAKKAGTATITVTTADQKKTATCKVTVTQPVTGVKLNKTALTMGSGQSATLTATVSPSNATNKKVTWKSSNTKLATVSSSGKVTTTANANGTVKITATTADGNKVATCTVTVKKPSVSYRTHVQSFGWQNYVKDGAMSGTSGMAKRLEGINIKLSNLPYSGSVVYRTHVQSYGWQAWKKDGAMSGTSGEAKRLEGIQIYLTGELAKHYDIYYCVHAQSYGWLGWSKNGVMAGTSGLAKRLEGIEIVLVPKGGKAPAPVGTQTKGYVCGNGTKLPENPYKGS